MDKGLACNMACIAFKMAVTKSLLSHIKFAELETILGDPERARAVFELAITQQALDMPEVLWKTYIDFEVELGEIDNARNLYR